MQRSNSCFRGFNHEITKEGADSKKIIFQVMGKEKWNQQAILLSGTILRELSNYSHDAETKKKPLEQITNLKNADRKKKKV